MSEPNRNHNCKDCGKKFDYLNKLLRHSTVHTGAKAFLCNLCNTSFTENGSLNRHILRTHTERESRCNECIAYYHQLIEYTNKLCLRDNNAPVNKLIPRPFTCSFCYRTFTEERLLLSHLSEHKSESVLSCANCHVKFGDIQSLNDHVCRGGPSSRA